MDRRRDAAIRETEDLIETAKELHAALRKNEAVYRRGLKALQQGKPVAAILEDVGVRDARLQLNDALEALEHHRRQVRLALTSAGLDEGMTIADTGRAWGFSRQLAARYAMQTRKGG